MRSVSEYKTASAVCLVSVLAMLVSPMLSAATVNYSFDFTVAPDNQVGSGVGNELQYLDNGTGTMLARVTSWYVADTSFEQATGLYVNAGSDVGLGICNPDEANCLANAGKRGITEANGTDWLLIMFDQSVNLSGLTVSPDLDGKTNGQWADVTFYAGSLSSAGDLLGVSYSDLTAGLGLNEYSYLNGGRINAAAAIDITAVAGGEIWGNAILIGPSAAGGADRLLLNNMSTVVPIPAAAWLLLSALSVLFGQKKWADRKSD